MNLIVRVINIRKHKIIKFNEKIKWNWLKNKNSWHKS